MTTLPRRHTPSSQRTPESRHVLQQWDAQEAAAAVERARAATALAAARSREIALRVEALRRRQEALAAASFDLLDRGRRPAG